MNKLLAQKILKLFGWKMSGNLPPGCMKCIVVMAPHTSNWDFVIGWLGYHSLGLRSRYLIKKEAFIFPLGILVKWLGGIPVDRRKGNSALLHVSEMFKNEQELILTITPEGTRALNRNWKRGFYSLARNAGVPIVLGFLDYRKKVGGLGPLVYASGDYSADMKVIESFYHDKSARFPVNFNLSPESRLKAFENNTSKEEF